MSFKNRKLIRKPRALIRTHDEEQQELDWLVETWGKGGAPAEVYREFILECIRERRHAANSLSPSRLDRNAFGALIAA